MVTHDITGAPFLFAVMVRRRTFFQEDPSIVLFTLWLNVLPFDEVEVKPCFVEAALNGRAQAESFIRNGKGTAESTRAARGTHTHQPGTEPGPWGQGALAKRSQQRLLQWY